MKTKHANTHKTHIHKSNNDYDDNSLLMQSTSIA